MHLVICLFLAITQNQAREMQPAGSYVLKPVQSTAGIAPSIRGIYTVSPDDQWIIYFGEATMAIMETPEFNHTYGLLRVLNLRSGQLHPFKVREEDFAQSTLHDMSATWASDSTLCVLPPPPKVDRRVIIRLTSGTPELLFVRLPDPFKPPRPREPTPGELVKLPETFTCSDCPPRDDSELFRKHIPKELLFVGTGGSLTQDSQQCASFDGTKVYYQHGSQGKAGTMTMWAEVTLYEVDAATGAKRVLVRHNADCPTISQLRPSPDGTKLAYQLTTGCGFEGMPEVIVLDLKTGHTTDLARGSGVMRWSSTSDKLYFDRGFLNEPDDGCLWVAEFEKAGAAKAPPAAASQPSK